MPGAPAARWEALLESNIAAPAQARRELALHLDGELGLERIADLLLLAGELVTNSVLHANGGEPREILLELDIGLDAIRVAVTDEGSSSIPAVQTRDIGRGGGRGLFLVDRMSDRWGMTRDGARGTRVWFEMVRGVPARPPPGAQAA